MKKENYKSFQREERDHLQKNLIPFDIDFSVETMDAGRLNNNIF